jgi:ribosomal protein S18 acetylase RimI-like enzyme
MIVREARPSDYAEVSRLFEEVDAMHAQAEPEVFQIPPGRGRAARFLDSKLEAMDAGFFVAEMEHLVVGFAIVRLSVAPDVPVLRPRQFAYLEDLVVSSRCHRVGVGRALMQRVEEWTRFNEVERLELVVWEFNKNAIEFYSALGYRTDYRWMSRAVNAR